MPQRTYLFAVIAGVLIGVGALTYFRTHPGRTAHVKAVPKPEAAAPMPDTYSLLKASLTDARTGIDKQREGQPGLAASLGLRLRFLQERVTRQEKEWDKEKLNAAESELKTIKGDLEKLAQGKSIALLQPGRTILMGYHSELDDSDQPYSLYIPKEYDESKPGALVLLLHGQGMFNPLQCNAVPIGQMIVAAPQGRGGMDYMYVGEGDVLRVLDEVQQLLKVDPNRVYLAGSSMGGSGSWHMSAMYPDRFAGIMPLCGNTDINVWSELWLWHTPKDSPIAGVRHFLREDTCAVTYAENLGNVGIVSLQGEADPIVNQLHARHMTDALKNAGHQNYQIHLLPFVVHGINADYDLGLKNFVRDPKPVHVHYKTAWLKYPGAYWLKITGIEARLKHAIIDGTADPKANTIQIKTGNVTALEIERSKLPIDGEASHIAIDGAEIDPKTALDGNEYRFEKKNGAWAGSPKPDAAGPFPPPKSARVEGPVEHAFMSRFLIVTCDENTDVPTKTPPYDMRAVVERAADDFVDQWKTRFAVPCRKKRASDVTPTDIADSNLILIGTPGWNSLIHKVIGKLPVSFEKDGVRFGEKKQLYSGPNMGLMLCYPNPLNPSRYVVLISGTTERSYADINLRFGNWFDWVPYDCRKHFDFAIFDDLTCGRHPESFLTWGFFGEHWEMRPELTFDAVPSWREKLLPRVFPTIDIPTAQKPPDVLYLDESFTKQASLNKEYLERNRTLEGGVLKLAGKEYKRGLYCRFPCTITFNCTGYKSLKVTAGVAWDGATEPSEDRKRTEKVTVSVSLDGKQAYEIKERTYKSEPTEIEVDLKGASTVTLSANGGLPWLDDGFIWADARLDRKRSTNSVPGAAFKLRAPARASSGAAAGRRCGWPGGSRFGSGCRAGIPRD